MGRICKIILFLLLISCNKNKHVYKIPLTKVDVGIALQENHLFLREYKRFLVTYSKENTELESVRLTDDNGSGANSYIYDNGNAYIIIDCNSSWYSVDKETGGISLIGSFWLQSPPDNYLGTFLLTSSMKEVRFMKEKNINFSEMYKYGGG